MKGSHILVPAARVGRNILAERLTSEGARVTVFPDLEAAPPSDVAALDAAIEHAADYRWLVFSGEPSVLQFLARPGADALVADPEFSGRAVALGMGTVHALADRGIRPKHAPQAHEPTAVSQKLGDLKGVPVLLVREETAEAAMPDGLRAAGAEVTTVAGYRAVVNAGEARVRQVFADKPKVIAFPNPTAARMLRRAFDVAGVDAAPLLEGVKLAAVGPETAAAATKYGFPPDYVSAGRITPFVRDIAALC